MKKSNNYLFLCFLFFCLILMSSCSRIKNRELYAITDDYIENIYSYSSGSGLFDLMGTEKKTEDGTITVQAVGKIIIVKLQYVAEDGEYEKLKEQLADRYSSHPRVRRVYINQGGTIAIDCRN